MRKRFVLMMVLFVTMFSMGYGQTYYEKRPGAVADLGDARIYHLGQGIFEVESDKLGMSLRLTFNKKAGWFVVACSSKVVEFTSDRVGDAVGKVIESAIASSGYGAIYSRAAGDFASIIASWAAEQGINYLCNSYGY